MENRNVIIAVILSTAILIGWSMFFENTDEAQRKRLEIQGKTETQTNIQKPETPQTGKAVPTKAISRIDALKEGDRVFIETAGLSIRVSPSHPYNTDRAGLGWMRKLQCVRCMQWLCCGFCTR